MSSELPEILVAAEADRAYRDDLTGLFNYRLLAELFEEGWGQLADSGTLSLVILDLDLFKDVNDTYGHLTGNKVLAEVAELLQAVFREHDVVIRYGGDEFVVLCPGAPHEAVGALAERAREAMRDHEFRDRDTDEVLDVDVSFSVGLATCPEDGRRGEKVLEVADRRLFEDKLSRRRSRGAGTAVARRLILPALAMLLLVSLTVTSALVERWNAEPEAGVSPQPAEMPTTPPADSPSRPGELEAELEAELERLRAQVENLLAAQAVREGQSTGTDDHLETISALQGRIEALEEERDEAATIEAERSEQSVVEIEPSSVAANPSADPQNLSAEAPPSFVHGEDSEVAMTVEPRLIEIAAPAYPTVARRMRREATIELRVTVDSDGRVLEATPIGSPVGFGFEEAARRAALMAVYEPGLRDGEPVMCETNLAVEFRLSTQ